VKKKIFLMLLLAMTLGFLFSMSLKTSFGFEFYATSIVMEGDSEWTLQIDGAVSHPIALTFNELIAMPRSTVYADLECYGRLVASGNWAGVRLRFVLEKVEFDQQAMSVKFYAEDGYAIDLSITDAMREDVIIAYEKDEELLPETLRLVLPGANGDRWIAMITHIAVSTDAPSPSQFAIPIPLIPLPNPQQFPTPQPSPTPQPTPSPSPAPSLSPTTAHPNPEPFPITWTVTAVATVGVASAGLIVYFKKRNH
jgi:DMSO/TMAO reductase YedYZ molybdopterin-dependent catalytic subunit